MIIPGGRQGPAAYSWPGWGIRGTVAHDYDWALMNLELLANWPAQAWWDHPVLRWPLTIFYLIVLLLVSVYGMHRYWLVWLYYRHRRQSPRPSHWFDRLPTITVQLPMYNESRVTDRVIDAACSLDYPRDRLQVQVLDDSTDGSDRIAAARVAYWTARGVDIELVHRNDRTGYKAGALAAALPTAKGELVAIFDADFVPQPGFLRRTVHYFSDPGVGMIQARWGHLNRDDSVLTRSQAIFLDGHFVIEHTARNRSSRWMNFNGTAGVWRREAIDSAGGWQHDTLTEDVDLSYRAQLKGWRFVFLPRLACPAELPPEINAFKAQQHRWTKGSIQTAKKLLPTLLRSNVSLGVKIEAFFHLTSPMVYLYVSLMTLLIYPVLRMNLRLFGNGPWSALLLGSSLIAMGTASACLFYTVSQREQKRGLLGTLVYLPVLMSIGIGIALNNARGCLEALFGHESAFERTPKYNRAQRDTAAPQQKGVLPTPSIKMWMSVIELAMGCYMLLCAKLSWGASHRLISTPFLMLFAMGYLYVGALSLRSQCTVWWHTRPCVPQPS